MEAAFGDPKSGHAAPLGARLSPHHARGKTALHAAYGGAILSRTGQCFPPKAPNEPQQMGDVDTWKGLCHNKVADRRDGSCQEEESPLLCLRAQQSPGALAEYHRAEVESGGPIIKAANIKRE